MLEEIKIGDLVRFTSTMPGIVTNQDNSLTIAAKDRPYLVAEVAHGSWQDSNGYDYVVFDGRDRIICMEGDIELIEK
jgi:hypothetical protein